MQEKEKLREEAVKIILEIRKKQEAEPPLSSYSLQPSAAVPSNSLARLSMAPKRSMEESQPVNIALIGVPV